MATIKPVLRTSKLNKKGTAPIYLRISDREKSRFISLGVRIRPSQWNDRLGRVRRNHTHADEINALITQRVGAVEVEILKQKAGPVEPDADDLKEALQPEHLNTGPNFFAFADDVIDDLERRGKMYTHKRYKSVCKKFRAFTGEPLRFEKITPRLLRNFETHLIEHYGNNRNTIAANFNCLRSILYRAIREGVYPQAENPFFQFKVKEGKTSRAKLSMEDLQAIEELDLESGALIWHVRNYFLFSFYCAGIRFGDLAKMKRSNVIANGSGPRLEYRMSKTGSPKSLKLLPQARAVLDHYAPQGDGAADGFLFPILTGYDVSTPRKLPNAVSSKNAVVNKYLKKIAKRAGITCNLSFHVSRHSFADIARQKGWGVYLISKALGHSSIKVTENYLKGFDAEALDAEMENLFKT